MSESHWRAEVRAIRSSPRGPLYPDTKYAATAQDAAGEEHQVPEIELDAFVQLTTPQQRLRNGHFDRHEAFALRVATCLQLDRLQRDPARGLLGPRLGPFLAPMGP